MVEPRAGDRLAGASVALTAEVVPAGTAKRAQFQYRPDLAGGPWIDIGGPILSQETLFTTIWDTSGLADLLALDLRILVNGTVSSGDDENTVVVDRTAPTIREDGSMRERTIRPDRTTVSRNGAGVWLIMPYGAVDAPTTLRLEPVAAPLPNGSALTLTPRGEAWRIEGNASFPKGFRLRIPGVGEALEIHHFDAAAGVWHRLFPSRVSHGDGWIEADVNATGIYQIFDLSSREEEGGGSDSCVASLPSVDGRVFPWAVLLAFLFAGRRRR
jgi:hypothetical protein